MKKELCVPCAEAMKAAQMGMDVELAEHRREKITCAKCKRRRYGNVYEIKKSTGGQNNGI